MPPTRNNNLKEKPPESSVNKIASESQTAKRQREESLDRVNTWLAADEKQQQLDKTVNDFKKQIELLMNEVETLKNRNEVLCNALENAGIELPNTSDDNEMIIDQNISDRNTKRTTTTTRNNASYASKVSQSPVPKTNTNRNRNSKIPPIIVEDNGKRELVWKDLLNITKNITFNPINAKKYRVSVTDNIDNYNQVLTYIKTKGLKGNTYMPSENKPISLLIRNLEYNTDIDEIIIKNEYKNMGFDVIKASHWSTSTMARNNKFFWIVQFNPLTDLKQLAKNRLICNIAVRYEKPLSKLELVQCRNCKKFQHSHTSCFNDFRCIKCPNKHEPGKCEYPSTSKAYCCNCDKIGHPANSPSCDYYLAILARKKGQKEPNTENQTSKPNQQEGFTKVGKNNKPIFNVSTQLRKTTVQKPTPNIPLTAPANNPNLNKGHVKAAQKKKLTNTEKKINSLESRLNHFIDLAEKWMKNSRK